MKSLPLFYGLLVAAASGALVGATLLAYDLFPHLHLLIFFGYIPLFVLWMSEGSARRNFLYGWVAQVVLSLVAFRWIAFTLTAFAHFPGWLAAVGLFFFCATAYLFLPIAGGLWSLCFRSRATSEGVRLAGLVIVLALAERCYPFLFPWHLGSAWLYMGGPAFQTADVIGFQGLSTLTLAINGLLAFAFLRRKAGVKSWSLPVLGAAAIYGACCAYGLWRLPRLAVPDHHFRPLVVQANVGNQQKMKATEGERFQEAIVETYAKQSLEALAAAKQKPDLVIWAETAYPSLLPLFPLDSPPQAALRRYLAAAQVPLATGAFGVSAERKVINGFFLLPPDGKSSAVYHKTYLMPFGEYVPGGELFPPLKKLFSSGRDFGRGQGPVVLGLNQLKIGPQICYEDLFDDFARRAADLGAQVLINITNDSWYGPGAEPLQHLYQVMGRAVETRRPFVRATNTGVSSAILADGTFLPWIPLDQVGSELYDIPYVENPPRTFFQIAGFWLVPAILWASLGFCLILRKKQTQ